MVLVLTRLQGGEREGEKREGGGNLKRGMA